MYGTGVGKTWDHQGDYIVLEKIESVIHSAVALLEESTKSLGTPEAAPTKDPVPTHRATLKSRRYRAKHNKSNITLRPHTSSQR